MSCFASLSSVLAFNRRELFLVDTMELIGLKSDWQRNDIITEGDNDGSRRRSSVRLSRMML